MNFKKIKLAALSVLLAVFLPSQVEASIYFKRFSVDDYNYNQLSKEEIAKQIQAFAYHTYKEPDNCSNRGEVEEQIIFCTNIHEAARARIALLMTINAMIEDSGITKNNEVRRIIDKTKDTDQQDEYLFKPDEVSHSEWRNQTEASKAYNKSNAAAGGNPSFFYRMIAALKQCVVGDESMSAYRLQYLNSHIKTSSENQEAPDKHPPVGCSDLKHVLRQFVSRKRIDIILNNVPNIPWLNFTQSEKLNYAMTSQQQEEADQLSVDDSEFQNIQSNCALTGIIGILTCPPLRAMGGMADASFNLIENKFILKTNFTNKDSTGGQALYTSWKNFRNISNTVLILIFLAIIIAYLLNYKLDLYQVKKILPKLFVLAILINSSFVLIQLAVDFSNVLASGIFSLRPRNNFNILALTGSVLSGALVAGTAIAAGFSIAALIPVIIGAFISLLSIIMILTFRDSAFVVVMILAPIAFASLLFPKTERFFTVWKKTIQLILLIPINVAFLFTAGVIVSGLMSNSSGLIKIFSIVPLAMQFYLLPKILSASMRNLPLVGDKISSITGGLSSKATDKYKATKLHKWAVHNSELNRQIKIRRGRGIYKYTNKINDLKAKAIDKVLPGYELLAKQATFNPEVYKEITDLANNIDPVSAGAYYDIIQKLEGSSNNKIDIDDSLKGYNTKVQEKVKTMLKDANPNQILASMITVSDDGAGDFEQALTAIKAYQRKGGEMEYLNNIIKTMESNYRKEMKLSDAAQLKEMAKRIRNGTYKYGEDLVFSEAEKISYTKKYILDKTFSSKFKGFKPDSVEDKAFTELVTSGDISKEQFQKIQTIASQNESAQKYLNKFKI